MSYEIFHNANGDALIMLDGRDQWLTPEQLRALDFKTLGVALTDLLMIDAAPSSLRALVMAEYVRRLRSDTTRPLDSNGF